MEDKKKIEHLVVDTTAFLQNAALQQYAENIYTCQEVVDEVTNKRQRQRLLVLPYDLKIKTVFPESIHAVVEFSKKTGDYPSLSLTDLKVMALTYQLEKEKVGISNIRTEPVNQKTVNYEYKSKKPSDIPYNLPGWYHPKSDEESDGDSDEESDGDSDEESEGDDDDEESDSETEECTANQIENEESLKTNDVENEKDIDQLTEVSDSSVCAGHNNKNTEISSNDLDELKEKFGNVDLEDDFESEKLVDDVLVKVSDGFGEIDEEGWITPSNYKRAKQIMLSSAGEVEDKRVEVACMTTDFSMQNVLKQMNLNVAALDGRVIKHVRTFILRCYACFKTTDVMTKVFCPKCGNRTLKKVAVSIDQEGKMVIHINARKVITAKGKRFSLPAMKGGKHPNNPILVEDQRIPHNRPSKKSLMKNNPLDDDYIAGYSPFIMRDVTSKAAQLGIRSGNNTKFPKRNGKKR